MEVWAESWSKMRGATKFEAEDFVRWFLSRTTVEPHRPRLHSHWCLMSKMLAVGCKKRGSASVWIERRILVAAEVMSTA